MAGNGFGYFEMCPWEVDLAPSKKDPLLAIFGSFLARKSRRKMVEFTKHTSPIRAIRGR